MDERISWLRVPERDALPDDARALLDKAEAKLPVLPNVFRAFSLTPEHFVRWFRYYDHLMRDEASELSRAEREMIGLVASSANRCEYCLTSHGAYLRELGADPVTAETIVQNHRRAHLTERERALLDFAHALTTRSHEMSERELEPLRAAGLSDAAIFEAAQVAAMFNFTNRLANALGWKPNPEYHGMHRTPTGSLAGAREEAGSG